MTRLLLVRHGDCHGITSRLNGRMPGVALSDTGRRQARALARALPRPRAILTSPVQRAMETAQVLAAVHGVPLASDPRITEIDYGEWTGRSFDELAADPVWHAFNTRRASTRVPAGETIGEVQQRAIACAHAAAAAHAGGDVVLVSHCDVIRALLVHVMGLPVQQMLSFDVPPGSVSLILIEPHGWTVSESGKLPPARHTRAFA